jgi:predicted small metal-binding protein
MDVVVTCGCGWTTTGPEEHVVEVTQVHERQIHGVEMTCDQVLSLAKPAS